MDPLSDCSLFIHMAGNSAKMKCVSYSGWSVVDGNLMEGGIYDVRNKTVGVRIRRIKTVYFSQWFVVVGAWRRVGDSRGKIVSDRTAARVCLSLARQKNWLLHTVSLLSISVADFFYSKESSSRTKKNERKKKSTGESEYSGLQLWWKNLKLTKNKRDNSS